MMTLDTILTFTPFMLTTGVGALVVYLLMRKRDDSPNKVLDATAKESKEDEDSLRQKESKIEAREEFLDKKVQEETAKKEKLEASAEEVEAKIKEVAATTNKTEAEVRADYEKHGFKVEDF